MQVCKSGVTRLRKIWLTRHGESEYNRLSLLGGDSNITDTGRAYAAVLPDIVIDRVPLVLSPSHALRHSGHHHLRTDHSGCSSHCTGQLLAGNTHQATAHCLTRNI